MTWAIALKPPKKAYLELLAQPAKIIEYIFIEEIRNTTNKSKDRLEKHKTGCKQTTPQPSKLTDKVIIGANKKN